MKRAKGATATTTTKAKATKSKKPAAVVDSKNGDDDYDEEEVAAKKPKKPKKKKEDRTPAEQAKAEAFHKFKSRDPKPTKLGQKKVPQGAPNCLEGKTFVVTGVLDYFKREDIEAMVEQYGGKNTKSISKKTSYLILGRDAGDSKVNKAEQYMIPQISEVAFLDMIRKSNKDAGDEDDGEDEEEEAGSEEEKEEDEKDEEEEDE